MPGGRFDLMWAFRSIDEARSAFEALRALAISPSPYRALLSSVARHADGTPMATLTGNLLRVSLSKPWPDAAADLSHPATSFSGEAAFLQGETSLDANVGAAQGRPFLDRLSFERKPLRSAERAVLQGRADVGLGVQGTQGQARHITYVVLNKALADDSAVQAAIAAGLPDQAWTTVLVSPSATVGEKPQSSPVQRLDGKALHITFDQAEGAQRALAERLQLRLSVRGAKVTLRPLSAEDVLREWNTGNAQVLIMSLWLPVSNAAAQALRGELAKSTDADDIRRRTLPAFAQRCPVREAPHVGGLRFDAHGLPLLEDLYLVPK